MMFEELFVTAPWLIIFFAALFFLAVGSLLNVFIYRLPLMLKAEWLQQCQMLLNLEVTPSEKINLFLPRCFCPNCHTTIKAWQNIPLLSYLLLRGKCFNCDAKISIQYPLVELTTLVLSFYALWFTGFELSLIFSLLFIWITICLIFIDFQQQLLPDSLTLSLLWLGLIANTNHFFTDLPNAVLTAAGAYAALWLFVKLFYLITGKTGMGHGDLKLFSALGAWFGWTALLFILILSSLTGAIIGLIYLKVTNKPKDTTIPFGPFLCIAGLITLFWGNTLIDWYLRLIMASTV
jgi:leader peptidase (prepilin peptidase)/N-methyltransferase